MNISPSLKKNVEEIKKRINAFDLKICERNANGTKLCVFYIDSVTDKEAVTRLVLTPIKKLDGRLSFDALKETLSASETEVRESLEDVVKDLLDGKPALFLNGNKKAITFNAKKVVARSVEEPPTSSVIKGPRAGFNENLMSNVAQIRQKIKSENLTLDFLTVGKYSATSVCVVSIKGITPEDLTETVKKRISEINTDAVLDSSYVARYLTKRKTSLFKQYGTTEKPDVLCSKLLEGRIAVIVDGSPITVTLPYIILEDFQSPADYYTNNYRAVLSRSLRVLSVILAVILPAVFVAAEMFHIQLLPLNFLLTIISSIRGIPLSPSFEMFLTLIIFEILDEASVRMPRHVGMVISIVGGLVLGETAVNAGIISAPTLMIVALSGICLYTAPELEETFSVLRFVYLIVAGALGGYAMIILSAGIVLYAVDFENLNTPVLAPYAPLIEQDLKDGIFKRFNEELTKRPVIFRSKNRTRTVIKKEKEK